METLSFPADEYVDSTFVTALRAESYSVSTVNEDYEQGLHDEDHLVECRKSRQAILTNDDDFIG